MNEITDIQQRGRGLWNSTRTTCSCKRDVGRSAGNSTKQWVSTQMRTGSGLCLRVCLLSKQAEQQPRLLTGVEEDLALLTFQMKATVERRKMSIGNRQSVFPAHTCHQGIELVLTEMSALSGSALGAQCLILVYSCLSWFSLSSPY